MFFETLLAPQAVPAAPARGHSAHSFTTERRVVMMAPWGFSSVGNAGWLYSREIAAPERVDLTEHASVQRRRARYCAQFLDLARCRKAAEHRRDTGMREHEAIRGLSERPAAFDGDRQQLRGFAPG